MLSDDAPRTLARKRDQMYSSLEADVRREEADLIERFGDLPRCPVCGAMRTSHMFPTVCRFCGVKEV